MLLIIYKNDKTVLEVDSASATYAPHTTVGALKLIFYEIHY